MKIISNKDLDAHQPPDVEAIVVDGSPWIHTHPPRLSKKFGAYCRSELIGPLQSMTAKRIDLVFDVYSSNSIKSQEGEILEDTLQERTRFQKTLRGQS